MNASNQPGKTQHLVIAKGFAMRFGRLMLIDAQGCGRLFFELSADPDQAQYSPEAAYRQLLLGMLPGTAIRLLNVYWPNPIPRKKFRQQIQHWHTEANDIGPGLHRSLEMFLTQAPLPFYQQVLIELAVCSEDHLAWVDSLPEWLWTYGIQMRPLMLHEVQALARHVFNTRLD